MTCLRACGRTGFALIELLVIAITAVLTGSATTAGDPATFQCVVNCTNASNVYSFHSSGANGLFGDGSVRHFTKATAVDIVLSLCTRDGGEVVTE